MTEPSHKDVGTQTSAEEYNTNPVGLTWIKSTVNDRVPP